MITIQIQTQLPASICPFPYFSCFPLNTVVCLQLISRMSLWPSLTILSCPSIFHSPISLPELKLESVTSTTLSLWVFFFFYGFLKMSTGPGAARDQHFCASVMALLHSYIPRHSLKYTCVIRSSVSPPSGWRSSLVLHYPWRIWTIFTISSFIPVANISLGNVITMWHRASFQVVLACSPNQPLFPTKSQGTY